VKTTNEDGRDVVTPIVIGNSHGLLGNVLSNAASRSVVLAHTPDIAKKDVPVVLVDPKGCSQNISKLMESEIMKSRLDDLLTLNYLPKKDR
jgi:hypothetical protein